MKKGQEIIHPLGIHLAHRFIKDEQLRMGHQNGRQGQPLPLASGKGVNAPFLHARKPHPVQGQGHFLPNHVFLFAPILQGKGCLVSQGHGKELVIRCLVHRARYEADIFSGHGTDIPAAEGHSTFHIRIFQKSRHRLDEGGLSTARPAGNEHHFPFVHRKIQMANGFLLSGKIAAGKIFDFQYHDPITCLKRLPVFQPRKLPNVL